MFNTTLGSATLFEQIPHPTSVVFQGVPMILQDSARYVANISVSWPVIWEYFTFSVLWKVLMVLHIAANFKHVPFIYHLRILNAIRFVLRSQRPADDVKPEQLFQPIITSSRVPLVEIDVFLHKSNSTYFADVDVARVHLVTTLFGNGIFKFRGSTTMNGLSGKKTSKLTLALGAVSCSFRRELLPYESYDMYTRILAWDEKWFYMVTHFIKKSAKLAPRENTLYPFQNVKATRKSNAPLINTGDGPSSDLKDARSPIAASALSKVVFKDGRRTLTPQYILELSELIPTRQSEDGEARSHSTDSKNLKSPDATGDEGSAWTWEKMESERLRGMEQVKHLVDQAALEQEFAPEVALGRHHDGYGVEGVLTTLAQLGHLSSYQLV
jgi:hypothetical protein